MHLHHPGATLKSIMAKQIHRRFVAALFSVVIIPLFLLLLNPTPSLALTCSVNSSSYTTGSIMQVNASSFANSSANHELQLLAYTNGATTTIQNFTPNQSSLTLNITVPNVPTGKYDVQIQPQLNQGGVGICQPRGITITNNGGGPAPSGPSCSSSPATFIKGATITITGSKFSPNEIYAITFGGFNIGNLQTDSNGSFSKSITVNQSGNNEMVRIQGTGSNTTSTDCGVVTSTSGGSGQNPCGVGPTGSCETALGSIPTSISGFSGKILSIATGLAGGIALIIMVVGAIKVLTSSGDQQKTAGGRDMIVAAVAGLLFLIFSALILRFIGSDLLGLFRAN